MKCKIKIAVIVTILALILVLAYATYRSYDYCLRHYHNTLEYKDYNGEVIEYLEPYENEPSVEELIALINTQTNTNYTLLCDTTIAGGYTYISKNEIYVNPNIPRYQFAWIYTHEIFHHTFYTVNERYVEFETFKFLFNNENKFLKHTALQWLRGIDVTQKDYDIRYYAYNYLKEKGYNIKGE